MSNFALSTWLLLVFVFAAGLALGSLARARYEQQKEDQRRAAQRQRRKASDQDLKRQA